MGLKQIRLGYAGSKFFFLGAQLHFKTIRYKIETKRLSTKIIVK